MGICEANGLDYLSPSACHVNNVERFLSSQSGSSAHNLSGCYGVLQEKQQLPYSWDFPTADRDCGVTEDRTYGKQDADSPYGDDLQSEDGSQTASNASPEHKTSKKKTKRFRSVDLVEL